MIEPATAEILKRLSKGKSALSQEQLLAFHRDLAAATVEEVLAAVAKRPAASRRPVPEKPEWLVRMESSRKRLKWTASEAVTKLIQIAADEGFIPENFFAGRKTIPAFATAAKQIAAKSDGIRLSLAYAREVERLEREYRLG